MRNYLSYFTYYRLPLVFGVLVILGIAFAVFAVEEERVIHVFPTQVAGDNWMQEDFALEQTLGGQAVFEDFNKDNSSFIVFTTDTVEVSNKNTAEQEGGSTEETDEVAEPTSEDTTDSSANTLEKGTEVTPVSEEESAEEAEPTTDTDATTDTGNEAPSEGAPATEEPTPEPLPDLSVFEYLNTTSKDFVARQARAQESEAVVPTVDDVVTTEETSEEVSGNEDDEVSEAEGASEEQNAEVPTTEVPATEVVGEGSTPETPVEDGTTQPDATSDLDTEDVRVCHVLETECYTLAFDGFDIGSVLSEEAVTGYTLKASLAARTTGERFTDDKVFVRYFYRGTWHLAGEIAITDSVSNFENGGHFTFALPNLEGWDALHNFKVEFEFVRQNEAKTEFFLDSVWVETTYRTDKEKDPLFPDNVLQELAELELSKRSDLLRTDEGVITLPYMSTTGGDLTLRSSANLLESPGTGEMYLSVTNIGSDEKEFDLSFYMPDEESEPQVLRQWMYNIPQENEVVEYGSLAQYCEGGWTSVSEGEEFSNKYLCAGTGEDIWCDSLNEDATNCIQNEIEIGKHVETNYVEGWHESRMVDTPKEEKEEGFLNRVRRWFTFKKEPTRESAVTYRSENTYTIAPNQTLYFASRMKYPQVSEGGFAVEVLSDDESTALDIAWKSDWRYRLPIEIDRDVVANKLTLELSAETNPHLFAHVSDWSKLFIRESESHKANWLPYTFTVLDSEHVELTLNLSALPKNTEDIYLYYREGVGQREEIATAPTENLEEVTTEEEVNPEVATGEETVLSEETVVEDVLQKTRVAGYTFKAPEEVILATEKDNRVIQGISEDGSLSEDGQILFAYRTNRRELREGDFAVVPDKSAFALRSVRLLHEGDGEVSDVSVTQTVGNEWVLDTGMTQRALKPGKYTLEVEVVEGERMYTDTQEFYWGVLTWNSTKSVYAVGETATMHMGVLTDKGTTICDAPLTLSLRTPSGAEVQAPVSASGACDGNNVTDIPDYIADYALTEVGVYTVLLQHLAVDGTVLHEIRENIVVEQQTPYVLERKGPTRINPTAPYTMTLKLSTANGFNGTVQEMLPEYFEAYEYGDATESVEGDTRILEWNVALAPGEEIELTYTFDAPDISPYVYRVGPATVGDEFVETRAWQIASDATGNMLLFWDGATIPTGWTCVSCTAGDPFYQRFIMGSSTYNATGGATTHTHTSVGTVYAVGAASTESAGSGAIEVAGHTHTYTPTLSAGSNIPPYRQLRVIRYNSAGEPASIPTGAIAIFDATVPTGWTRYNAQDGNFIYGENTVGTTGGSATHQHTISGSTGASVGDSVGSRGGGVQAAAASDAHTHTVSGGTGSVNNEPPYVGVLLGKLDATTTPPNSMISMWTEDVPTGWVTMSSSTEVFSNKFIKPGATYGGTGGVLAHNHVDVIGLISSTVNNASSRQGTSGAAPHSQTVDVTNFSTSSNLPPYVTAVFGKRFSTTPVYTQSNYRFFANNLSEPPTDPWPLGVSDLIENARITTAEYTSKGDVVRMRMSVAVSNATSTAGGDDFSLQYAEGSSCNDTGLVWNNVAPISSTTAPWRGYNNSGINDGATVSSTTLSTSNVFETYEEENPSATVVNEIAAGNVGEWDWVVQHNEAKAGTDYCFRMVKSNGDTFSGYTNYPQLITNGAPVAPTLRTLFDNEKISDTEPVFTFYTTDPEGNAIQYQIQVDDDYLFGSPSIDANSISTPSEFSNLDTPADKSPFNSGDTMKYTPSTSLSDDTTYWWRVRGRDSTGSDQWGQWSDLRSFTTVSAPVVSISTWFQTTDEQFNQNTFTSTQSNGSDQIALIVGSTTGSVISETIDFDWGTEGNAWGYLLFSDIETASDIKYQLQFYDESDGLWKLIPDSALGGNAVGFDTSPVTLLSLDTTTYNQIRIKANFTNSGASPLLNDWTIEWGTRVQQPTLTKLFDNEKVSTTTPVYEFSTTDPQNEDLVYQISISTDYLFVTGSTTRTSDTHAGFQNLASSTDTSPFVSGNAIRFTLQGVDALTNNTTYWWKVRAKDPTGGDTWSDWSERRSFTVDTTVVASTWHQTTNEQFDTGGLFGITTMTNAAHVATSVKDVLVAYGEGTSQTPKYRIWDGTVWGSEYVALNVGAQQNWVVTRAHPTAEMFALATLGSDADVNVQVYEDGVWGNLQEMTTTISNTNSRGVDMAFETSSGDLLVAYCDGDADPSYRIYNEATGWSSAGAINLSSTNNCEWIRLASDPTSDEIIVVSLDSVGGQYEAQVWNGSAWGNATVLGSMFTSGNEGMAVQYEESGGQAVVAVADGRSARFTYNTWNGTAWSGAATQAIGDDLEWASLTRDKGTDAMAFCYIDLDANIGVVHWTGSAWTAQTEIELIGNSFGDRPVDCSYETNGARDGYLMTTYSDDTNARYQSWNGAAWSLEGSISSITDSSAVQTVRSDDGLLLSMFFDDVNGRYDFSFWNGSAWSAAQTLESSPSVTGSPYKEPFMMAPRKSAVAGTLYSPTIDYNDGTGPQWEQVSWNDAKPGASTLTYQVQYYDTASSSWKLVPDSLIPGNSTGTSTSPISISDLNTTTYNELRLKANFVCVSGNCPVLYDWTVTWSEGFTISGVAKEFDQTTNVTGGTVAVAVNGALQIGKTAVISGGVWSLTNITAFSGDVLTIWVDNANEADEAVAVTKYDGDGPVSGVVLYERHLTIGSDDTPIIGNSELSKFDNSVSGDEDIFFNVDISNDLYVCETGQATCGSERLWIKGGSTFQPSTSTAEVIFVHDIDIAGTLTASGNTFEVSGSWKNAGAFLAGTSHVIFDATSTTENITSVGATTASFNTVTFGQGASTATWTLSSPLDINGALTLSSGTLAPGAGYQIALAGNLTIGASGFFTKANGTTTFDGTGTGSWSDASVPQQDMGTVVVDGTSKTVSLTSNVSATTLIIGLDDILALGSRTLQLSGSFNNTGSLVAQTGKVSFVSTAVGNTVNGGASSFYDLSFNGGGGNWSFPNGNVTAINDVTILQGIVTMPNGTTTIGGSLSVTGGQFVHNNGLVSFSSNVPETITASTSPFFNMRFIGNGSWTLIDTNVTASNNVTLSSGGVTFPTGVFAIGGSLISSAGTFAHANGTVRFYSADAETISTFNSSFNNVVIDGATGSFVVSDTNTTVRGNMTLQAGVLTLPGGVLTLGGSLTTLGGTFAHNNGTVLFAASSTGHTITAQSSPFYNVLFNSAGGGWTIIGSTTSMNNWSILQANTFVAPNGGTVEVRGLFSNMVAGTQTTWTGSTLYLNSGLSNAITAKTTSGDVYDTIRIGANTDVAMWNSAATIYMVDATGSLYSQDHNAIDGALYIWGSYGRTSGTEHWAWATDFDGTSLGGGSERQVSVRFADTAHASITTSTLNLQGSAGASTTIANQGSGSYGVTLDTSTVQAQYYSFNNLNSNGFTLQGSTTVNSLSNGEYVLAVNGGTLLRVSSSTLDANPAKQILGVRFATTSPITGYNAGIIGTAPLSYWTFKNHSGGFDGEQYDDDPTGNPGTLRWDNSAFSIDFSGRVYTNEGSGVPAFCNGSTQVVFLKVNGTGSYSASCAAGTGAYAIPSVTFSGDVVVTAYLQSAGTTGAVVTKTPNGSVTNLDIYEHRVIVRHEDVASLTIADMTIFDNGDNSAIPFTATLGTPNTLTLLPDTKLFLWSEKQFTPGGNITLTSGGSGASYDGSLYLGASSTLTSAVGEIFSVGGSWVSDANATFVHGGGSVLFTATTSGKIIAPASHFNDISFTGAGGGWVIASSTTVRGAVALTAGTVSGTGDLTVYNGPVTGDGVFAMTGGTVTILGGGDFGGANDWTFNDLLFSTTTAVTTSKVGTGDITIGGTLTIGNVHTLQAGTAEWFFSGLGTVFEPTGVFVPETSTVTYNGSSDMTVAGTDYYRLTFRPSAGTPTYSIESSNFEVGENLVVGGGTSLVVNANTNDPLISVLGDVTVATNATYQSASANDLFIGGSFTNDGMFAANGGGCIFNSTDTGETIDTGASSLHHVYFTSETGGWTITENLTATGNFSLSSSSDWTLASGRTLEVQGMFTNRVGGTSTTWTGSTLYLNSGTSYSVSTKAYSGDVYNILSVGANTDVRMWYSTSTTYTINASGSLYSQDHNEVNGDLYIFGDYARTTGSDYWSYATDFDGADLGGGNERAVDVYVRGGSTITSGGGTLEILGTSTAITTIQNQGSGTYGFDVTGGTLNATYYALRNMDATGLTISGSPTITSLSDGDLELGVNAGSLITVAASAITANPLRIMYRNRFATTSSATTGTNVTVTGVTGSSWRFTSHSGGLDGEGYDVDPAGDPGYVIWDNSAAQITLSGNVRGTDESSVSSVCDGSTPVVRFMINGASPRTASCNAGTGYYEFTGIIYNVGDVFTVYLDTNGGAKAVNITADPITNINDMHLYENRLIVRHESLDAISILDLSVYDRDQDTDILFDADAGSPNTLALNPGSKLIVWSGKKLAPGGNVSVLPLGNGTSYDGTLELKDAAQFIAAGTESHIVGGSLVSGAGASLTGGNSTFTFTATSTGKTVDTNTSSFGNIVFNGVGGAWTFLEGNATTTGDVTISNGSVVLATSTFAVGGSFINNAMFTGSTTAFRFTASSAKVITLGGYSVGSMTFAGTGSLTMTDTNATSTGSVLLQSGSIYLPSGTLSVRSRFENTGGVIYNRNGTLELYGTDAAQTLRFGSSTLGSLKITGSGSWIVADANATTTGSIQVLSGGLTAPTGSFAIGASLIASSTFNPNAGTLYFFATSTGHTINTRNAVFGKVIFDGVGGGWTVATSSTSTSNWMLARGASFTMATGTVLEVGGLFSNTIGGAATNWTNSTLFLNAASTTAYAINAKTTTGDMYANLTLGANTHVSMWNSGASTTTVPTSSYLYSQDHAGSDGVLNIYGTYERIAGTEYWSYATDFDGVALGAGSRIVNVRVASSSSVNFTGATLQMLGIAGATSTLDVITSGAFHFGVTDGTLNAQYYKITGTDSNGLLLSGSPNVTTLNNGMFELRTQGGSMMTVGASVINNNPSRTFTGLYFATGTGVTSGYNINLSGTTNNIWQFTNHLGNYDGEAYDNDGADACGQIRWSDSACLEISQTHYRFRNDDGGEGASDAEWYDIDWLKRKPIKINNAGKPAIADYVLKVEIPYDSDMQADFDDLRFTNEAGTTTLSYWIEEVTLSATATAWVKVPSVSADSVTRIYMYYDNALAVSAEDGVNTFTFFDDFEDNSLSEYSGSGTDLSYFATNASYNYEGSYGLSASGGNTDKQTSGGIYRTNPSFAQGSTIRFFQKITAGTDDEPCTLFGVGGSGQNYAVCLDQYPTDRVVISEDVTSNSDDGSGTELASASATWGTGWYEVEIDWLTDNSINVTVYDANGASVASVSTTDSSRTSGGMGFSFWYQSEGWDFYSVRPYVASEPNYSIGVEQVDGGATWKIPQDTILTGQAPNENFRVRFTMENTGTQITGQTWRLQYAPKSTYGACEGVPTVEFNDVPNQASCGTSPVCMTTSANVTDQELTTEHLTSTLNGTFINGYMTESPSNQTSAMTLEQNEYTEVEYAVEFTDYATDSNYCMRSTNGGVEVDTYLRVAEASVRFAPVITNWKLNSDQPIALIEGGTQTIYATGTVSDLNGFSDILYATSSIYRTGVTASCISDPNNCYQINSFECPFTNCSGNSCDVECSAEIQYFAEPTDGGSFFEDEGWEAVLYVLDTTNNEATTTSVEVDIFTLWGIGVTTGNIEYGTLNVGEDTGSTNATTSLQNTGNDSIDVELAGSDLAASGSAIPVANQKFATSSFTYSSCVICSALSGTASTYEIDLTKPTSTTPVTDTLYWGVYVPVGTGGLTHYGQNTFYATGD